MIEKHVLDNGVRVIIEKIPTVRSVALGIWIGTGSKYETPENNGISHFIEHMFFKGTTKRTAKEIAEAFDQIGGHVNAFTSKEYTCYYARVLDEHAPLALDILADMYFNSLFDVAELNKEKKVVIEEIKMYNDTPDDLVHDLVAQASFQNHSLGYSILGMEEVLYNLTRSDILQYVEDRYTPENTVITIAGNIDDRILSHIAMLFSSFSRKLSRIEIPEPDFTPGVIIKAKETEQAHLCLSMKGYPVGDNRMYSLILMNNILGGSMSSRLFQEIREERGLSYSIFSYHTAFEETGMFTIYAGTTPEQLEETFHVICDTLKNMKANGISQDELKKGKEQLKGSLMLSLESTNSRMSRLGKNELLLKRHLSLDEIIEKVEAISIESVQDVAADVLSRPMSIALVSPLETLPDSVRGDVLV